VTIRTRRRGTASCSARKSTSASFAAPSTGGAWSLTRSAPSWTPAISFADARGWTRTLNRTASPRW